MPPVPPLRYFRSPLGGAPLTYRSIRAGTLLAVQLSGGYTETTQLAPISRQLNCAQGTDFEHLAHKHLVWLNGTAGNL
jgi:hypothetical protein